MTATVDGVGSVDFTTIAVSSTVTQKYEIVSSGGVDVPASSARRIYELFDDGTYAAGSDQNGTVTLGTRARFVVANSSITFCSDPRTVSLGTFVNDCGFLLGVGAVTGDTMHVIYRPVLELDDEIYVRQP